MKKLFVLCIVLSFLLVSCETGKQEEVKVDEQTDTEMMAKDTSPDSAAVDTSAMEMEMEETE